MAKSINEKFREYFQPSQIEKAFIKYKDAKHDVFTGGIKIPMGADGISYKTFEKELSIRCKFISQRVLAGSYLFYPFREVNVPKPSGQERVLSIATIRDVLVQKILYEVMYDEVENRFKSNYKLDLASCAYRKGKSAPYAATLINRYLKQGFQFAFDADIIKFFDRIDHKRLIDLIDELFDRESLVNNLLRRYIKTGRIPYKDEQGKPRKIETFYHHKPKQNLRLQGIPQGGVLSGMLANLYLHKFDCWILDELSKEVALRYVRYADDFVVLLQRKNDISRAHFTIEKKLAEMDLELHKIEADPQKSKTKYVDISQENLKFVGFEFTVHHIKVSYKNIQAFREKIAQKINQERTYKYQYNPNTRKRFNFFIGNVINKKIRGRGITKCPICHGMIGEKVRSWIGFFSVITDIQQLHDLDKWIRSEVSRYFYHQYKIRLSRSDFRKAGLASLEQEYYHIHKLEQCACQSLDYIIFFSLYKYQFSWFKTFIVINEMVKLLCE
ncbi:reverse transcriptase domain-containing protein [[Phormidium] sp. ETS-05]|uniref:reverse transcriptase domain-containing protein n=1 Tax=[Phormidium] sp. ETS-05 TaxID=222819 RepID=UPI0018EEF9F9|nr:reverse transcriptase domain-containing protein [[Phormidium] sp. ETS-05]